MSAKDLIALASQHGIGICRKHSGVYGFMRASAGETDYTYIETNWQGFVRHIKALCN